MKILWVNPSFKDYRIPVYKKLNEMTGGDFHIIYARNRVAERIPIKMYEAIGDNSHVFDGEKRVIIGDTGAGSNKWFSFPLVKGLYKLIKKQKPDVVIAEGFFQWTPWAVWYAHSHNVPLLLAYERTKRTERNCPKWRYKYRQFIDRFVDGYLCNGSQTKEYLLSLGVNEKKLYIGGMSADSEGLQKSVSSLSSEEKIEFRNSIIPTYKGNGLIYIYVGRLIPLKGLKYLLAAWMVHKEFYTNDVLLIVGGGELYDDFRRKYGYEKSIILTGEADYDSVYKYYSIADVFVIPTLDDNWSLVVPEAMSIGLPIACSIYNGCFPELCREGENGKLFDPENEGSILEALKTFHLIDLEKYGRRSKDIEKMYDANHVSKRIYDAVLSVVYSFNKK